MYSYYADNSCVYIYIYYIYIYLIIFILYYADRHTDEHTNTFNIHTYYTYTRVVFSTT